MKKKNVIAAVIMIAAFIIGVTGICQFNKEISSISEAQKDIASKIIRFHVRADSDSDEDQAIKLKVRDRVVSYLSPLLSESSDINESRTIIENNISNITNCANDELASCGCSLNANVYLTHELFPVKTYGDTTFPSGEYEALRVDIGSAKGHNWWCVLYPPLCFTETNEGVLPQDSKEKLKNTLTDEEYREITDKTYTYRFKYLTFLNDWFGL